MALTRVERLDRIVLNSADADRLAAFFVQALGFERTGITPDGIAIALGTSRIDLREVGPSAPAYPADVPGWNPLFQHCAIVVTDMTRAMQVLERAAGWHAITRGGPQRLPANAGGVTAFKFRDPEGHPLELLAFPDRSGSDAGSPFVRVDHSAISVADVERSVAFYADLGLAPSGRTLNVGPAQESLDDVDGACVDVVPLALPSGANPHVELLGYRGHDDRPRDVADVDSIAATRLVFARARDAASAQDEPGSRLLRDPDGHLIVIEAVAST